MRTLFFKNGEPALDPSGNIKIITGLESLAENIDQRLKLFRGKWFLDITAGVPYLQDILKKPVDPGLVAAIINAEILKEPEVVGLGEVSADFNPNTREFSYSAMINHIFNNEPLEVSL